MIGILNLAFARVPNAGIDIWRAFSLASTISIPKLARQLPIAAAVRDPLDSVILADKSLDKSMTLGVSQGLDGPSLPHVRTRKTHRKVDPSGFASDRVSA